MTFDPSSIQLLSSWQLGGLAADTGLLAHCAPGCCAWRVRRRIPGAAVEAVAAPARGLSPPRGAATVRHPSQRMAYFVFMNMQARQLSA